MAILWHSGALNSTFGDVGTLGGASVCVGHHGGVEGDPPRITPRVLERVRVRL